jgi:hypothetical protein
MRVRRLAGVVAAAALLVGSMGTAAVAAAPPNDDVGMPTVVNALPFSTSQDTAEATTPTESPTDPLPSCTEFQPVGATVWFSYTPDSDGLVQFDTFGSDYDTVLAVYVDGATTDDEVACNDDAGDLQSKVTVDTTSGETYLVMVGSFPGEPGGSLWFQADVGTPPLEITVSIDPRGSVVPKTGEATIRGMLTCSEPKVVGMESGLRQRSGRMFIDGWSYNEVECDGSTPWEMTISEANGLFSGGKAEAIVWAYSYDDDAFAFVQQNVRLSGVKAKKK